MNFPEMDEHSPVNLDTIKSSNSTVEKNSEFSDTAHEDISIVRAQASSLAHANKELLLENKNLKHELDRLSDRLSHSNPCTLLPSSTSNSSGDVLLTNPEDSLEEIDLLRLQLQQIQDELEYYFNLCRDQTSLIKSYEEQIIRVEKLLKLLF